MRMGIRPRNRRPWKRHRAGHRFQRHTIRLGMPAVRSGKRRIQRCGINTTPFEHKERMPRHDGSRVWAFFIARRNTANSDSGKEPPRVVRQARTPLIFKHIHTALKRSLVLPTNKPSLHSKQALFETKRSLVWKPSILHRQRYPQTAHHNKHITDRKNAQNTQKTNFCLQKFWQLKKYRYLCTRKRKTVGAIAQLVEQRTENPCVPGSIPGGTTNERVTQ